MHFTYDPQAQLDLNQGDVVGRTPAIDELLKEVHPHYYKNQSYEYFIVLTQSCDLVRRPTSCKARYITIAAVRPLRIVLEREIAKCQRSNVEANLKFCSKEHYERISQFVERLLNNNQDDFFFLYKEPSVGMAGDYCAFLHLSIAVKSELHYDTLLAARKLQLRESFQHKLGYLVGKMYSRIATEDWLPKQMSEEKFNELRTSYVENEDLVIWLEKAVHRAALTKLKKLDAATAEDFSNIIAEVKGAQDTKKAQVVSAFEEVLTEGGLPSNEVARLSKRFVNNPTFITAWNK